MGISSGARRREAPATLKILWSSVTSLPLLCGALSAIGQAGVQLMIPLVLGSIVDDALVRQDARALWNRTLILVLLALVSFVGHCGQRLAFTHLGQLGLAALQGSLLAHIHTIPKSVLDRLRLSEMHAFFTEDCPRLASLLSETLGRAFFVCVQMVGLITLLGWKYGSQAYFVCILVPLYLLVPAFLARKIRGAARRLRDSSAGAVARIQDLVRSTREIRIFGREAWAIRALAPLFEARRKHSLGLEMVRSFHWLNYTLTFVVGAVIYWQGGLLVFEGQLTIGELIALVALLTYLESPVRSLVNLSSEIQAARASMDRLEPVLSTPGERAGGRRRLSSGEAAVAVEFRGVEFVYPGSSSAALTDLSFSVPAGARIGVVGPSGAGKSTMVALLLRLYDASGGSILLDGRDIREYDLGSLRGASGFVPQDPILLPGTLRENVRFGNPEAGEDELLWSCEMAGVHEFAEHLPRGYQTEIGDRGVKLSGGQRQRLAIARVLLRDPALLILDEATAALDLELQERLLKNLARCNSGTTFTISHRVQAVSECRLILVLEQGRLMASGNHAELMRSCALYRRLSKRSEDSRESVPDVRAWTEETEGRMRIARNR